jgi:hypothetical protein
MSRLKTVKVKKKRASAASVIQFKTDISTANEDPELILVDDPRYRKVPGLTMHYVTGQGNLDRLFFGLKDFPLERDYVIRLNNRNVRKILETRHQPHMAVQIMTLCKDSHGYDEGTSWVGDGHTRRAFWLNQLAQKGIPLPTQLYVLEHVHSDFDELVDMYYQYNSADSTEQANEIIKAKINDLKLKDANGNVWVGQNIKSVICKTGALMTVLNYTCANQDTYDPDQDDGVGTTKCWDGSAIGVDWGSSWDAAPIGRRSTSMVRNDIYESQLKNRAANLIILDDFIGEMESKNKGKGPRGKYLYDGTVKAALMIAIKAYGNELHPNIIEAFENHVDTDVPFEDPWNKKVVNYEYNINRLIRDAKPSPKDPNAPNQSEHRLKEWRGKRTKSRYAVADTVWNLVKIAEQGVDARAGSPGDVNELMMKHNEFIAETNVKPRSIKD